MPRRCSSSTSESPSHELWGPDGVTPVYYPSGGPNRCQHPLFLLERGLQWFSGLPGFGYRVCATRSETYVRLSPLPWSPLSVPSYPPRCGGGPVHPPSPHPPAAAVSCIVRVVPCVCQRLPRMWHGACGVCVVSGCECELRVRSRWANMAVGQVLNSAVRGLSSPARCGSWGGGSGHGPSGLRAMLPNWQWPYCPALTFSPPVGQ